MAEYYLRARTYNPATGRFSQEDIAKDGTNWYAYCGSSSSSRPMSVGDLREQHYNPQAMNVRYAINMPQAVISNRSSINSPAIIPVIFPQIVDWTDEFLEFLKFLFLFFTGGLLELIDAKKTEEDGESTQAQVDEAPETDVTEVDLDNLPEGWTSTDNNGHIHVRDENGNIRIRIDPPDNSTRFTHKHMYDQNGNPLDANGNIVPRNSPNSHIPYP